MKNLPLSDLRFRLAVVLTVLFLLHFAVGTYLAEKHPAFFLQNDGNEYFE